MNGEVDADAWVIGTAAGRNIAGDGPNIIIKCPRIVFCVTTEKAGRGNVFRLKRVTMPKLFEPPLSAQKRSE